MTTNFRDYTARTVPLAMSAVAIPNTGSTTENVLATIPIPAGMMGLNGVLRITTLWSWTSSANAKTPRIRLGGAAGTVFASPSLTTSGNLQHVAIIRNRGAANSQVGMVAIASTVYGLASGSMVTATIDTSAAQDLVISAQLALGTETVTLESYIVELVLAE